MQLRLPNMTPGAVLHSITRLTLKGKQSSSLVMTRCMSCCCVVFGRPATSGLTFKVTIKLRGNFWFVEAEHQKPIFHGFPISHSRTYDLCPV